MKWLRLLFDFCIEPVAVMAYVFTLYGTLFLASVGQALLLGDQKQSIFALMLLLMIPGYIVFFLTFFNVSPVPPRLYLAMLLLAMSWYGTVTIICELLLSLGEISAANDLPWKRNVARAMMHLGWISFIPIAFLYRSVHKYAVNHAWLPLGRQRINRPSDRQPGDPSAAHHTVIHRHHFDTRSYKCGCALQHHQFCKALANHRLGIDRIRPDVRQGA